MVSRWYKNAAGRNCSGDPAELRLPADAGIRQEELPFEI